jgi:hypothetical protein
MSGAPETIAIAGDGGFLCPNLRQLRILLQEKE